MKFLLAAVNAKYIHSNPAVYSLRAFAGSGYEKHIEIAEYTINQRTEDILADLYRRKPDVIGFSCYLWNWSVIRSLLSELPKLLPHVPLWLGGPEVTFDAERILRDCPAAAGVMAGEGEQTFFELLQFYLEGAEKRSQAGPRPDEKAGESMPAGIAGLVFRQGDQLITTAERKLLNLDCLPFPYRDMEDFHNRIVYYESSRGCPFRCGYCLSSVDKTVRFRPLEKVKGELQFFLDRKVKQVKFVDRTFNCDRDRTVWIWEYLLSHDNGITNFHFEIAAELLTRDELKVLSAMRAGLVQLEIGVQSANPDTLREIHRFADPEKLENAVKTILAGKNVHVHLDLIAGLPFEDYESFGHSFDRVYRMRPHQLQLGFLKVLKGSPLCEKADGYGINYTSAPPYEVLYSKWLPYDGVRRLKRIEELVELYYNSGQFTHTLPVLERAFAGPFAMYERLAAFYEDNGLFTNSPSRLYRYEALLSFAVKNDGGRKELYRELLTFDLYLRENLKSRPPFARPLSDGPEEKQRLHRFYEREEAERKYLPSYTGFSAKQLMRMTHAERFCYRVWEETADKMTDMTAAGTAVIFDYRMRNPLTGEARVISVSL